MRLAATATSAPAVASFAGVDLWRRVVTRVQTLERAALPGYAVLVGAVLAPLAFVVASFTLRWPWLGMPAYNPAVGIDLYAMHAAWAAWFVVVACLVKADRPLALAVLLIGGVFVYRGGMIAPRHALMFAVGALLFHAVRRLPARGRSVCHVAAAGLGVVQAGYMLLQVWGYDPLWFRFDGGVLGTVQPLGTLGTVDGAAAYVAMTTPLMTQWLMPLGVGAVLHAKSGGAMLALMVGLALRFRSRVPLLRLTLALSGLFYVAMYWASLNAHTLPFNKLAQSMFGRLAIWELGLRTWASSTSSPLTGWGLGGWDLVIPQVQQRYRLAPTLEWWREAHNDLLQFVIEAGLLGAGLLGWWLWQHRAMWSGPWGPSVAALAVVTMTFFPFHVASTAFLGILLLGCATPSPTHGDSA